MFTVEWGHSFKANRSHGFPLIKHPGTDAAQAPRWQRALLLCCASAIRAKDIILSLISHSSQAYSTCSAQLALYDSKVIVLFVFALYVWEASGREEQSSWLINANGQSDGGDLRQLCQLRAPGDQG